MSSQPIELGRDLGEGQAELIDQEALAGTVGDQHGVRIMRQRRVDRNHPGEVVVERIAQLCQ
jgi:hypothetical protein